MLLGSQLFIHNLKLLGDLKGKQAVQGYSARLLYYLNGETLRTLFQLHPIYF